jgi:hypothetical protein
MISKIPKNDILKILFIVMVGFVLTAGIMLFSFDVSDAPAFADYLIITHPDDFSYETWSSPSFNPLTSVIVYIQGDEETLPSYPSYTINLTNLENSSYQYNGTGGAGSEEGPGAITWQSRPQVAGKYRMTVNVGTQYSESAEIVLKAMVFISKTKNMTAVYNGNNQKNTFESWNYISQHYSISQIEGLVGSISNFQLKINWGEFVSDIVHAGTYDFELVLNGNYDYIDYQNNVGAVTITKRPLLIGPDIALINKTKTYDGTNIANGKVFKNGEGSDAYDYLLTSTSYGSDSGLLEYDYEVMKEFLDTVPIVIFNGISTGESSVINSYFMDAGNNPSSTVSGYDAQGNIIYDKKIRVYYGLNPALHQLMNYVITIEQDGDYVQKPIYAEYLATECAILPGIFVVSVDTVTKEYGVRMDSLNYELLPADGEPQSGNIAVRYSGDLLDETIGIYSEGVSGIRIAVKIGRLFRQGIDSTSDIVFSGMSAAGEEVTLVEYTRYTPLYGNYYFYVEVFYDGIPIEPAGTKYACGNATMSFVPTLFNIAAKQLQSPPGMSIMTTKEYDGLKQAYSSNTDLSSQFITDRYYVGANLVEEADSQYIQSTAIVVYDTAFAGTGKIITVTFQLSLTEAGRAQNKDYLLSSYTPPAEIQLENCTITKKVINFSFDMTNAVDRPFEHPFFYPNEKVLIFQKPYSAAMPIIKDLVFGDYVLDEYGQIIYEEVYAMRPKTIVNEFGAEIYELDIYGNIVYEPYGEPFLQPKRLNYFIMGDDAESLGVDWSAAIDMSFYCIEEYYEGILRSIQITRYTYDPATGMVTTTIVDSGTSGAVLRTIGQDTPPTGNSPGIRLGLLEFETDNYILSPKGVDNMAYFRITKRNPEWDMAGNQVVTYNGRQNSNMLEDIEITQPQRADFPTEQEYQVALQEYNLKRNTYARLININLAQHGDYLEIIGSGGLGINFNVLKYAPPGAEEALPVGNFSYASDIRLIKHAGQYEIEVWLPETTSYTESEIRILYLTIEQAKLNVYLSPSQKDYKMPNPTDSPIPYKDDTSDPTAWGWRLFDDFYPQYFSTIIYQGFINNESPLNIGFGEFVHCSINYGDIDEFSYPGEYSITAQGGYAHNYYFDLSSSFETLTIRELKAVIEIINDDISVTYDPYTEAWSVDEYVEGVENPIAAYTYSADDNTSVEISVVGYKPLGEEYDFSPHFVYMKDIEGNFVLDNLGNKIAIGFYSKVVKKNGVWVEYTEGDTGEILDCTPGNEYKNAKLVGNYILRLYARPVYYADPDDRFVALTINPAETQVQVTEGVVAHTYDGAPFSINGLPADESDDNFIINNKEITIRITVDFSTIHFDEGPIYTRVLEPTIFNLQLENTGILNAGYYKITFYLSYDPGIPVNYTISQTEYILYVEVSKGKVTLQFAQDEGAEQWYYTGKPYELLDPDLMGPDDLGVIYSVNPAVPFNSLIVQIYKYELDAEGNPIEDYGDDNEFFDPENNPIPLPHRLRVDKAINAGWYLFRIKASGSGTQNYDDSEWVQQKYLIQKSEVGVYIRGKLIPPEEQHLYPGLTRYPLSKVYGEENPEDKLEVYYSGWQNGEDPSEPENSDKYPAGFMAAVINWNIITQYTNARPETPYPLLADNAYSDNYNFVYFSASFFVLRRQSEIITNPEYTTSVYTGTEQQESDTFRAPMGADQYADNMPPYAFALNYDPAGVNFTIVLKGRLNADNSLDTSVEECVDVGTYVFSIAAAQSTNYSEIEPTDYYFTVAKRELKAFIADKEITYGDQYPPFMLTFEGFVGKDAAFQPPVYLIYSDGRSEKVSGTDRIHMLVPPTLVIPSNAINVVSGGYTIRMSQGSALNYWINVEDTANLNILKKDITVDKGESIIKVYDGTTDADDFVEPRNYVFTGIIKHHLKPSIDIVGLRFSATFDSPEVGSRKIVYMRELYIDNNNYRLLTEEFTCDGEITKVTPIITLLPKEFVYDGMPKELTPSVTGLHGSAVNYTIKYKGVGTTAYSESQNPPTIAGIYEVTVTTDDPNYIVRNVTASMKILKAKVNIYFGGDIMQTYGAVSGLSASARGVGNYSAQVPIRYFNQDGNEVLDIKTADSGTYTARAIFGGSANFSTAESVEELWITAKSVTVNFSSVPEYVYDGTKKEQIATFYNVQGQTQNALIKYARIVDGEEEFINVGENGGIIVSIAPKDVGTYVAYAVAPNDNYALTGELSVSFSISKKHINITVNDITIDQGKTPNYTYTIDGIAVGESVATLDKRPVIYYYDALAGEFVAGSPEAVGVYRIIPAEAEDNNYTISYTEGKLTVNSVQLVASTNLAGGLMLQGSFSPDTNLKVRVVQNGVYSKAGNSFEVFKMNNKDFANLALSDIYEISLSEGAIRGEDITIRMLLPSTLRGQEDYQIAHIKLDGSIEILNVTPDGDYLEFTVSELGSFGVIVEQEKGNSQLWTYFAIAGAVLVILLGIVIIRKKA